MASGTGQLILTPAVENEAGTAFSTTQINTTESFETNFGLRMSDANGFYGKGDGIAFILQPAAATALGSGGGSMGYGGLSPSVEVEFDTFQDGFDPPTPYVALMENGDDTNHVATSATPLAFPLYGGAIVSARIVYDATAHELSVYAEGDLLFTTPLDLADIVGKSSYAGFGGGTGWADALQEMTSWTLEEKSAGGGGGGSGTSGGPTVIGTGTSVAGPIQGVTWGTASCDEDYGCFPVSFRYKIEGTMAWTVYERSGVPPLQYEITHVLAFANVLKGQNNAWGLDLIVGVRPELIENWQQLGCVFGGSTTAANIGFIPLTGGISNPEDAVLERAGPIKRTMFDPLLEVFGAALPDEDPANGVNIFAMAKPTAGLGNSCVGVGGASARRQAAPVHWPSAVVPPADGVTHVSQPNVARRSTQGKVRAGLTIRVDGQQIPRVIMSHAETEASAAVGSKGALTVQRTTVALAVLEVLLATQARHKRQGPSPAALNSALGELEANYVQDPAAARQAGIVIPAGETPHAYFFRKMRAAYKELQMIGSVRNAITARANDPGQRSAAFARWLRHDLKRHRVSIRGLKPFAPWRFLPADM